MNNFADIYKNNKLIFTTFGTVETIKRAGLQFNELVSNAFHIYDEKAIRTYTKLWDGFLEFSGPLGIPTVFWTPTFRTSYDNVLKADAPLNINEDSVKFLTNWKSQKKASGEIIISGVVGPARDCYTPSQSLNEDESQAYHGWQIEKFSATDIDFISVAAFPAIPEIVGVTKLMNNIKTPYIVSFLLTSDGKTLDGTPLSIAIRTIDEASKNNPPFGYMANCSYPGFLDIKGLDNYAMDRFIGYIGNASSKNFSELESSKEIQQDPVFKWLDDMESIYKKTKVKILGGCCGTNLDYMKSLALIKHFAFATP